MPRKVTRKPRASSAKMPQSQVALLLAAERLFAEHGAEGVSLRQINEAAGQRNASAIHYHFGSREGMVEAVMMYRMSAMNERRMVLLKQLESEGRTNDTRALVSVLVRPLAELLVPNSETSFYLRFLERMTRELFNSGKSVSRRWRQKVRQTQIAEGWRRTEEHLRNSLVYLPKPIISVRFQHLGEQIVSGLASIEVWVIEEKDSKKVVPMMVENLIDSAVASLTAPISADTLAALRNMTVKTQPFHPVWAK